MRTETLAIVFTDIKGYTAATAAQTHGENAQMLRRIERIIAPVVRGYSGRVVKSIGDAYMIVFRSPTEAVRCATAIQDRLHQHNTSTRPDQAIHIRIAMNIGEVRVHRGDVFGDPVNIAARIEAITPANEIYFSEAVYLTMNRSQLPSERVGEFDLKGIPEPVAVFRAKQFVHSASEPEADAQATVPAAAGLPFGGMELSHWQRMRWVRRAYLGLWALVVAGLAGAAYLRYRPSADYTSVLGRAKEAVEAAKPIDAIALVGQIPPTATQERFLARRLRRQAAAQLIEAGNLDMARSELSSLLDEDGRDADALLLQGTLLAKKNKDLRGAVTSMANALKINPALASRPEVTAVVVLSYRDPAARRIGEQVVESYLKQAAVPALSQAVLDPSVDLKTRTAIATRLDRLGAGGDVDWVALALEELKSTSCRSRLNAIQRLQSEADERAVGPLMKIADSKGCGAAQAKKAIELILGKAP